MMQEGRLSIDLYRNGDGVERVAIASSRPLDLGTVFEDKSPDEAAAILPLLFSICANAQGRAGAMALERALGLAPCEATEAARDILVRAETARELLLGIALHWPDTLDEEADKPTLRRVNAVVPAFRTALFDALPPFAIAARAEPDLTRVMASIEELEELVRSIALGLPVEEFAALTSEQALTDWAEAGETVSARLVSTILRSGWQALGAAEGHFLPELEQDQLKERLFAEDAALFTSKPEWSGTACETTILSRHRKAPLVAAILDQHGQGLLARVVARLVDLAQAPGDLRALSRQVNDGEAPDRAEAPPRSDGTGLAQIEAARGRLIHAARVGDGHVLTYRIVAPTEWNFHPRGAAANGLCRLEAKSDKALKMQASLLIDAIDPCVGYDLRIH